MQHEIVSVSIVGIMLHPSRKVDKNMLLRASAETEFNRTRIPSVIIKTYALWCVNVEIYKCEIHYYVYLEASFTLVNVEQFKLHKKNLLFQNPRKFKRRN